MWWRRSTATLLDVSFGTYSRRRRDVLMGSRGYVPLRHLDDVPMTYQSFQTCLRRCEDVLMGRRCCVLLRRHQDVPIRCRGDVPLRRLGDFHRDVVGCFI